MKRVAPVSVISVLCAVISMRAHADGDDHDRKLDSVSRALYVQGRLWLLSGSGELSLTVEVL